MAWMESYLLLQGMECIKVIIIIIKMKNFKLCSSHGHHGSKHHKLAQHTHSHRSHAFTHTLTSTQFQPRCTKHQLSNYRIWNQIFFLRRMGWLSGRSSGSEGWGGGGPGHTHQSGLPCLVPCTVNVNVHLCSTASTPYFEELARGSQISPVALGVAVCMRQLPRPGKLLWLVTG